MLADEPHWSILRSTCHNSLKDSLYELINGDTMKSFRQKVVLQKIGSYILYTGKYLPLRFSIWIYEDLMI